MGGADGGLRRKLRVAAAWLLTLALVIVYFALPNGENPVGVEAAARARTEPAEERRLDVIEVSPADAVAGAAITIAYVGALDPEDVRPYVGREEMPVLARKEGAVVARLPGNLEPGRVKIRVASGGERSKPYDIRIKAPNWRKPFRNLVGGFALLVFGIGVLARGARAAAGLPSAHGLSRVARRGTAALGLGALLGVLAQSTTAAAGVLAGLVASSVLAVVPAACAFLGAQIGAASAPLVTGLIDPREGLLVIAVGVLWLGLATDRRAVAIGRLVLGAGLIAFGLQTMRPGFEPFVQDPELLSFVSRLRAENGADVALCALLGAALVATLQGPAPVLVLVLVLAQTTAHWDLETALAVLSGSGLGAAVGALLTTPAARRCRRLAELHLLMGAGSTLLTAATVGIWSSLADSIVPGVPHEIDWGKRVLMPNLGLHLGVGFALSQLAAAIVLLPLVPLAARLLNRVLPADSGKELARVGDSVRVVRARLLAALSVQQSALEPLLELALHGRREAGRIAEHRLADAHALLEESISGPLSALPKDPEGSLLARLALGCLQLERALESVQRQAERLVDRRVALSAETETPLLLGDDELTLRRLSALLDEGIATVAHALETGSEIDLEAARAREIRMNGLEAHARSAVLAGARDAAAMRMHLAVLGLVDALEAAGNHVYRLAETLGEGNPTQVASIPA